MLLDSRDLTVLGTIPLIVAGGLAFSPDASYAYASLPYSREVAVLRLFIELELIIRRAAERYRVAIRTTPGYDAHNLDPESFALAGARVSRDRRNNPRASFEDTVGDGAKRLVIEFDVAALKLNSGQTEVVLEGKTYSGVRVRGLARLGPE